MPNPDEGNIGRVAQLAAIPVSEEPGLVPRMRSLRLEGCRWTGPLLDARFQPSGECARFWCI